MQEPAASDLGQGHAVETGSLHGRCSDARDPHLEGTPTFATLALQGETTVAGVGSEGHPAGEDPRIGPGEDADSSEARSR